MKACFNFSKKMVLWNRSSSAMEAGGITGRTGSSTENQFSNQSTSAQSTNSSSGGAWGWIKDHSGGFGKAIGALTSLAGTAIGAVVGGPTGAAVGASIAKGVKDTVGGLMENDKNSSLNKFAQGLTNKKTNEGADKLLKSYEIYKNDKLDKLGKLKAFNKLMETNVVDTSNGHVPVGYSAASSQGAVISTGSKSSVDKSKSTRDLIQKINKKAKGSKKTKQTKAQKKGWNNKNKNKKKK